MSKIDIDVFLPTSGKRLWGALYQIQAVLANPYNVRVTVASEKPWLELEALISDRDSKKIRWVCGDKDFPMNDPLNQSDGYGASPKTLACMERLDWADWLYLIPDDDAILPWAMDHFMEAKNDKFGMIVSQSLPVSRREHIDYTPYTIGRSLRRCRISLNCTLLNMRMVEKLEKPYFKPTSAYCDWQFIDRMGSNFPVKWIKSATSVLALCEEDQLLPNFRELIKQHNVIG